MIGNWVDYDFVHTAKLALPTYTPTCQCKTSRLSTCIQTLAIIRFLNFIDTMAVKHPIVLIDIFLRSSEVQRVSMLDICFCSLWNCWFISFPIFLWHNFSFFFSDWPVGINYTLCIVIYCHVYIHCQYFSW